MKRNSALFGASLVAGIAAAAGLVATSAASQAATDTAYGVAYQSVTGAKGWSTGAVGDGRVFTANATASGGVSSVTNFSMPVLSVSGIGVVTKCTNGKPSVTVTGGGAAGTYTKATTITAAKFTGSANLQGTVTLLSGTGPTVGAYVDLAPGMTGTWIKLGGVTCGATTSSSTSKSSSPSHTSTSGASSSAPSSSSSSPTTTEPPTPTPSVTTTLPVTG